MSTTTDLSVAVRYGMSRGSMLFLIKVDNFLQYGAELTWLSAFPSEAEVCACDSCSLFISARPEGRDPIRDKEQHSFPFVFASRCFILR